jgi:hypothetical protein
MQVVLDALAMAAATALVGSMATDAWQAARSGFTMLLGRGDRQRQEIAVTRLVSAAAQVAGVSGDEQDRVRRELLPVWQVRLRDLVEEHPELADELRALADQVRAQVPAQQQAWIQHNIAHDHGKVIANQGGTQHIHLGGGGQGAADHKPPDAP